MAVLIDADRAAIRDQWMRENDLPLAITKAELRAAVDAVDAWTDANTASFNAALPLPARTALSARQKAWIFFYVLRRRYEVS